MPRKSDTCRKGHKRTRANTYVRANGNKVCRICSRAGDNKRRAADPEKYRKRERAKYARSPATVRARKRREHAARQAKRRERRIRQRYDLTVEEYDQMVAQPEGCDICGTTTDRLVVDHCHVSNKRRGVLCDRHNLGLSHFSDQPLLLLAAAAYLLKAAKS